MKIKFLVTVGTNQSRRCRFRSPSGRTSRGCFECWQAQPGRNRPDRNARQPRVTTPPTAIRTVPNRHRQTGLKGLSPQPSANPTLRLLGCTQNFELIFLALRLNELRMKGWTSSTNQGSTVLTKWVERRLWKSEGEDASVASTVGFIP
ncbi:hypothetical protein O181_044150 [Austropuccinia psidii MF-1]|uniref:Uncharacterized protein n=1 Tax=Austropuccinia psidii MF-1 TaxID=1389203 RepID=A0A9Q3DJJ3_9BASI|nr:hypothetical protein [Austropuccinia psidii MF-1]